MKSHNHSRRAVLSLLGIAAASTLVPERANAGLGITAEDYPEDIPHTVAQHPWSLSLGYHRVRIHVENPAEAVGISIPWRRIDANVEQKAVLVIDANGKRVLNVAALQVRAETGVFVFEARCSGDYFVYYLPHAEPKNENQLKRQIGDYLAPEQTSDVSWRRRYASMPADRGEQWQSLPKARVIEFQARTSLDSFWPMEVAATEDEIKSMCGNNPDPVVVFVEDRERPIKMLDKLPYRWIGQGPQRTFCGEAFRGEFYAFQIGLYGNPFSAQTGCASASIQFDALVGEGGEIPASAWWNSRANSPSADQGKQLPEQVAIISGAVQALWCGVQVPLDTQPGKYSGRIHVRFEKTQSIAIDFALEVNEQFLRAGGNDQPWRLARLRWLDSAIGSDDTIPTPYTPLEVEGRTVKCLGRQIRIGGHGLPESIEAGDQEILASPIALNVFRRSQPVQWSIASKLEASRPEKVEFSAEGHGEGYDLGVRTAIEFDGAIACEITLVSKRRQSVSDIALEIPYLKDGVPYAVGMGLPGGARPQSWKWSWAEQPQTWKEQGIDLGYFCWLGGMKAGLYCRLKSPLDEWQNGNRGKVSIQEAQGQVLLAVSCGPRTLQSGQVLKFVFRLMPTPLKPLDPDHWKYRYAHAYEPAAELQAQGATVINVHHSMLPNQYINYPFLNMDLLIPYVTSAHDLGMKVKLYYTVRELTTRLPELWAFRSLGNEIYVGEGIHGLGDLEGNFWLREHIRDDYSSGWVQPLPFGDVDTSLRVNSKSRLANFYLEGLKWLVDNAAIDGLYLDEIGYTRETMQRVRRVLDRRSGTMIDMHANHMVWSCNCPIGYYMEHLPYIDRLWLGEAFDPDSPPDFWLIEMSGLPFGLSSDMLERPNPWRGMLFGMTSRAQYSGSGGPGPSPIWRLWDSFGIQDAEMIGWWDKERIVNTNQNDVLATVYRKQGKALIAVASWSKGSDPVRLDINWSAIGLEKEKATMRAPTLEGLQKARTFLPDDAIIVPPGQGCLLIVEHGR